VLPRQEAIARIRTSIEQAYGPKGEAVVASNLRALEASLDQLHRLDLPEAEADWQAVAEAERQAEADAEVPAEVQAGAEAERQAVTKAELPGVLPGVAKPGLEAGSTGELHRAAQAVGQPSAPLPLGSAELHGLAKAGLQPDSEPQRPAAAKPGLAPSDSPPSPGSPGAADPSLEARLASAPPSCKR
jgi:hypothetical protein